MKILQGINQQHSDSLMRHCPFGTYVADLLFVSEIKRVIQFVPSLHSSESLSQAESFRGDRSRESVRNLVA